MSTERTAAVNALTALLRVTDLGIDARRALTGTQIATVAAWRTRTENLAVTTASEEATRLAKRVTTLDAELKASSKRIADLINQSPARVLLQQPGHRAGDRSRRADGLLTPRPAPQRGSLRQPCRGENDKPIWPHCDALDSSERRNTEGVGGRHGGQQEQREGTGSVAVDAAAAGVRAVDRSGAQQR